MEKFDVGKNVGKSTVNIWMNVKWYKTVEIHRCAMEREIYSVFFFSGRFLRLS